MDQLSRESHKLMVFHLYRSCLFDVCVGSTPYVSRSEHWYECWDPTELQERDDINVMAVCGILLAAS